MGLQFKFIHKSGAIKSWICQTISCNVQVESRFSTQEGCEESSMLRSSTQRKIPITLRETGCEENHWCTGLRRNSCTRAHLRLNLAQVARITFRFPGALGEASDFQSHSSHLNRVMVWRLRCFGCVVGASSCIILIVEVSFVQTGRERMELVLEKYVQPTVETFVDESALGQGVAFMSKLVKKIVEVLEVSLRVHHEFNRPTSEKEICFCIPGAHPGTHGMMTLSFGDGEREKLRTVLARLL